MNSLGGKSRQFVRTKFFRVGLVCLIVIGLVYGWMRYNQTPAEGVITSNTPATSTSQNKAPKTAHYTGNTASFDYPSNYTNIQNNTPKDAIAEQMSLTATAGVQQTRRIAVTIKRLGSGVVMVEDAAYKIRVQDTTNYNLEKVTLSGVSTDMLTKQDNSEITYFIPGPRYYAIISGTSANVGNGLADDLNGVVGSFAWNQ